MSRAGKFQDTHPDGRLFPYINIEYVICETKMSLWMVFPLLFLYIQVMHVFVYHIFTQLFIYIHQTQKLKENVATQEEQLSDFHNNTLRLVRRIEAVESRVAIAAPQSIVHRLTRRMEALESKTPPSRQKEERSEIDELKNDVEALRAAFKMLEEEVRLMRGEVRLMRELGGVPEENHGATKV